MFCYRGLTYGLFIAGNHNVSGKEDNACMQLVTYGSWKHVERDLRDYFHLLASDDIHFDRYIMKIDVIK